MCDPHQQFQNPNDDDDDEDDVSLGLSAGELLLLLARRAGAAGAALVQHLQWMSRSLSKLSFFLDRVIGIRIGKKANLFFQKRGQIAGDPRRQT